jgi:hypothetical protein
VAPVDTLDKELRDAWNFGDIETLPDRFYDPNVLGDAHGTRVASRLIGYEFGICIRCKLVWMGTPKLPDGTQDFQRSWTMEDWVVQLQLIINDIRAKGRQGTAIVNWSAGAPAEDVSLGIVRRYRE